MDLIVDGSCLLIFTRFRNESKMKSVTALCYLFSERPRFIAILVGWFYLKTLKVADIFKSVFRTIHRVTELCTHDQCCGSGKFGRW